MIIKDWSWEAIMFFDIFISKEDILMLTQLMCQTKNPLRINCHFRYYYTCNFFAKAKVEHCNVNERNFEIAKTKQV
jgi:hypothetical protein